METKLALWVPEIARRPIAFAQVREDPILDQWVVERLNAKAEILLVASGGCTAAALADSRQRKTDRRLGTRGADAPATRQRWHKAHRLRRYNITQHQLDRLLEAQEFACGMCLEPFGENRAIFIDHDHACCQEEKRSCGRCIRGLLCLDCNTTLGKIERKLHLAQAYLASPPAQLALAGGVAA